MLTQFRKRLNTRWFDLRTRGIHATPRVLGDPASDLVVLSQLHHPDVTMYLLAAKSFARHIRPREFVIVDDGLTEADREHLAGHIDPLRFIASADVARGSCPSGGCWERLMAIVAENERHYVIQLDADTLTIGRPEEVLHCVRDGRSFTLGTRSGREKVSLAEAAGLAAESPNAHIQNLAERALARYPDGAKYAYVRGCAGFAGFARGALSGAAVEAFSRNMETLVGAAKWREWGSEQVTSNFLVANLPNSLVLPVDRYPFWSPTRALTEPALVHFFGTFRFSRGMYRRQAARLIQELST